MSGMKLKKNTREHKGKAEALATVTAVKTTRLNANIPSDLYKQLKHKAINEDKTINDVMKELITNYVSD